MMRLALLALVSLAACGASPPGPGDPPPVSGGARCGGYADPACAEGQYCFKDRNAARGADIPGECHPKPQMCPQIYRPVCGADYRTYPNACAAAAAGANVIADGACPPRS